MRAETIGTCGKRISQPYYQDFLADFSGVFSHLDPEERKTCLEPQSYTPGQALAKTLLYGGCNGIVYPSVGNAGRTCIACFRPALAYNPRRGKQYRVTFDSHNTWDEM